MVGVGVSTGAPGRGGGAVTGGGEAYFLSTADVYREADRLCLPRDAVDFSSSAKALSSSPGGSLAPELIVNDLASAAITLCPPVADALRALSEAGADHALVCGSGPTVVGVFWDADALPRAAAGAERLRDRFDGAVAAGPVRAGVSARSANPSGTIRQTGS